MKGILIGAVLVLFIFTLATAASALGISPAAESPVSIPSVQLPNIFGALSGILSFGQSALGSLGSLDSIAPDFGVKSKLKFDFKKLSFVRTTKHSDGSYSKTTRNLFGKTTKKEFKSTYFNPTTGTYSTTGWTSKKGETAIKQQNSYTSCNVNADCNDNNPLTVDSCVASSGIKYCRYSSCAPQAESCDGADNDCDGAIDEGLDETKLVGSEFQITNDVNKDGHPAISFGDNRYLLAWSTNRNTGSMTNRTVFGRILATDGTPISSEFEFDSLQETIVGIAISYDSYSKRWLVVWTDDRLEPGAGDLYGQIVDEDGFFVGSEFVISAGLYSQYAATVAPVSGKFFVAWEDERNSDNPPSFCDDVYARFIDTDGSLIASEITISDGTECEGNPEAVYSAADDKILVVWEDWRNSATTETDIYGRFIASDGAYIGSEFDIINETYPQQTPDVAYNSEDGTFMVVSDEFASDRAIKGQKLSANGEKIGSTFQLNDNPDPSHWVGESARIAYSSSINKYLAIWGNNQTSADGYLDTIGQFIKSDGSLEGINFNVSNAIESQTGAALAAGPGQEFLAVWGDQRAYPNSEIWGQRIQGACGA